MCVLVVVSAGLVRGEQKEAFEGDPQFHCLAPKESLIMSVVKPMGTITAFDITASGNRPSGAQKIFLLLVSKAMEQPHTPNTYVQVGLT